MRSSWTSSAGLFRLKSVRDEDSRVRTRRGVAFGSTFQRVIQAYTAPDSYEINGNTIVVKFLQRERVAFRLQKLSAQGKHVVTGVVVAAAGS